MVSWAKMLIDRATELGRQLPDMSSDSSIEYDVLSIRMSFMAIMLTVKFDHLVIPLGMDRPRGTADLSPYSVTLVSGFLAVISVNVVIAFYIYLAMREPADKHEPDPKFVADAKDSVKQFTGDAQQSSQPLKKQQ
ncbi:hypothetical protein TanjilG_13148 [Lupinus angustifolius]|nr:hypothetical protein TanjilG_13148 [Lupinus angustifolius]